LTTPTTPAAASPRRGTALPLVLLGASCLGILWLVHAQPVIGVSSQYFYPYRPSPPWGALPTLLLLGLPLVVGVAVALMRPELALRRQRLLIAAIILGSVLLRLGTAYAPKHFPGVELAWPFLWKNTEGAYASEVRAATPLAPFLASYAERLAGSASGRTPHRVHLDTHPPGIIVCLVGLERFYDAFPSLARSVEGWAFRRLPSVAILDRRGAFSLRHPIAVSLTAAHLAVLLASLAPLFGFLAVRRFWATPTALVAAGLLAVIPGAHFFNPSLDQVYPTLTMLLCWLAARAIEPRDWVWGAALGLALYGATFLHVAYALVPLVLAAGAVIAWRADCPQRSAGELLAAHWRAVAAAGLAFLAASLALRLAFGYPTFRVMWLCFQNNRIFYEGWGRTYWPWVAVTWLEAAVALGFGVLLAAAAGWLLDLARAVKHRSVGGRSGLLIASFGALVGMNVLGLTLGEAARLWLFLSPLVVVGVVDYALRRSREPRRLLGCLFTAQVLHGLVLSVVLDCGRTTTFMLGILPKP